MSKQKLTAVLVLLLVFGVVIVAGFLNNGNKGLISPGTGKPTASQASFSPAASSYNPPKEIKYDSSTDLKQELESVDPEVLDSDFTQ